MKICVFGTRGFPNIQGGVEKHCENLYTHMPNDIKFDVCRRKSYVTTNTTFSNINFVDISNTQKRGLEAAFHSLASAFYAIKTKPDAVHIHNIGPGMTAPLLKLFGIKTVLTYHSANYEHEKWNGPEKLILRFCEHIALKYSDRIIFVNKEQMGKYSAKIQAKSAYIPNGVNPPIDTNDTSFLKQFGLEKGKYIISVGRITPEKGFDKLIEAFYKSDIKNEYKLAIVGGVEFENEYKKQLDDLIQDDKVVFTGYACGENLAELYQNARLYVLSSFNEGFPLVLLEAMSYNLDIIASDISAAKLVKLDDSDYYPPSDTNELAKKINQKVLSDFHNKKYDLSEYDWKKIADKTASIYKEMLHN